MILLTMRKTVNFVSRQAAIEAKPQAYRDPVCVFYLARSIVVRVVAVMVAGSLPNKPLANPEYSQYISRVSRASDCGDTKSEM